MATRDIVPRADGEGEIGTTEKMWLGGHFKTIYTNRIENEGSGDTPDYCLSSYTSWAAAIAAIGSNVARLIVDTDATVSADSTVPSTLMVRVYPGCIITIATTKTLTFNGGFEAGQYQVFTCSGTGVVVFGGDITDIFAEWFGYSTSATAANNTTYFNKAVASMSGGQNLVTGSGTHSITNIVFNPPTGCKWMNFGLLQGDATGSAVTIGNSSGANYCFQYQVTGLRVASSTLDHTSGRYGVVCRNLYHCYIDLRYVYGYNAGVFVSGEGAGVSHNEFHFGSVTDNKYSLYLYADSSGWCNDNQFYGGEFNWASAQDTNGWVHITLVHNASNKLNNNRFFGNALQSSTSTGNTPGKGISCDGIDNYFCSLRYEMGNGADATPVTLVTFTANSNSNSVFYGYGLLDISYVSDSGAYNHVFTRNNVKISGASTGGIFQCLNAYSNTAPVISALNGAGTDVANFDGNGNANLAGTVKCASLTSLKVPKHVDDATGLADTSITVDANNQVTNANQPAFLVTNSAELTDVTGDDTDYTVVWNTEIFDQNADFASNTFTAPVTGRYLLTAHLVMQGLAANHTTQFLKIVTSNRTYSHLDTFTSNPFIQYRTIHLSIVADMDVNDTATVLLDIAGGSKVVDVVANGYFSGALLC